MKRVSVLVHPAVLLVALIALLSLATRGPSAPTTPVTAAPAITQEQPAAAPTAEPSQAFGYTPEAEASVRAYNAKTNAEIRGLVRGLVNTDIVRRMDVTTGKFYMNIDVWDRIELNRKEQIVKLLSGYRKIEYRDLRQVTLYASRTGAELASFGVFTGVTVTR